MKPGGYFWLYMNEFLNTGYARRISFGLVEPEEKPLNEEQKEEIMKTEHVLSLEENNRWGWPLCDMLSMNGEQVVDNKPLPNIKIPGARVVSEYKTIAVFFPFLCRLVTLRRLVKIIPGEAVKL